MEYTLNKAPINKPLTIKKINNLPTELCGRLNEIGLIAGQTIIVKSKPTKTNLLVLIRDCLFALDIAIASCVVVYG